jgi:hypothetical protein
LNAAGTVLVDSVAASPASMTLSGPSGSAAATASYTFASANTYQVRFCANLTAPGGATAPTNVISESNYGNNCGPLQTVTVSAYVNPVYGFCTAAGNPTPSTATVGQTVTWTGTSIGSPSVNSYTWNVTGGTPSSQTSSSNVFHTTFASAGSYQPVLTVTNGVGTSNPTQCTPVTVTGAPPPTCSGAAGGTIDAVPNRVQSGNTTQIGYSATGIPTGDTCTVTGPGVSVTSNPADSSCNVTWASATTTTPGLTEQSVYTLACSGWSGNAKAVVNIVPKFTEF